MPFTIVRDDITRVKADAIVNAANEHLWAGGGVCGAIFKAAGIRKLQEACDEIGFCETGNAVATPGFALPATYVIHTVGPVWQGGTRGEKELLTSCYRTSLELAASLACESIAFPLISAGIYGYPHREALEVAQAAIKSFLDNHEMDVMLVLYDPRVLELADDMRLQIERYIDDVYVESHDTGRSRLPWETQQPQSLSVLRDDAVEEASDTGVMPASPYEAEAQPMCPNCGSAVGSWHQICPVCSYDLRTEDVDELSTPLSAASATLPAALAPEASAAPRTTTKARRRAGAAQREKQAAASVESDGKRSWLKLPSQLRNLLTHMDAGFSETLLAMIDARGLKDAHVYKRANISRQHFSKIRSNPQYKPTKTTVLALAVALELSLDDTGMLLERAGYALSHADRRDVIVEFFIREGIYDIFQINDALFAFDQPLLA